MGTPCEVQTVVAASSVEQDFSTNLSGEDTISSAAAPKAAHPHILNDSGFSAGVVIHGGSRGVHESGLDPRYVFDTFVVGASNQFAHASAVAVAEHPARQYNPLFLYSPPGLGKTHLLHAIGNHLLATKPNSRVAYLSAEKFVNELIESVQHRRMSQFRAKYRDSYDMILIDDIQFIAGKSTSEEEFFHTFNELYSSKRQIVLSCDRPPKEIEGLEERLRTRFEWGLLADITPPEIETRIAILKAKAERDDIYLPDEVATFLASHIKTNVRELEGVLIRLQAHASLSGAEISLEMAKQELKSAAPEEGAHFTIESIQGAVAKHFHLKLGELKAPTRVQNIALPRQIAMYLIRKYTGLGYKEIGRFFGGKDHSTIMHGCRKVEGEMETNALIRDAVEAIQNSL
jgi:chromosomal replication initiator protein